jgi:ubiquinone biosynthesis UbiH/UbiF/VisC/COQ6 family hydroxylase
MKFDLIIVGGGLAGLSLAVALRDSGRRIALVEHQPPQRPAAWDTRVYAISPASRAFLESIGCWRHLDPARIAAVEAMDIRGDAGGRLRFTAWQACADRLADIVEASAIACELWETVRRQSNVCLFHPRRPATLTFADEGATLALDQGERLDGSLVVGADGRDSWVRAAAGLVAAERAYDELGVVANFRCERPHGGTAYQWFRRDGVLAWLPLPGNLVSMVWSTPTPQARDLLALAPEKLALHVGAAGDYLLGAMEALGPAAGFPLRLLTVAETIAPRCALIGDAAHGIHPLSGHGINLGFADAAELARIVSTTPLWQDIGQRNLLRRYQRARREEVWLLQQSTHALHELFRTQAPGLSPLRNIGLSVVDRLPFFKSALARYAMG